MTGKVICTVSRGQSCAIPCHVWLSLGCEILSQRTRGERERERKVLWNNNWNGEINKSLCYKLKVWKSCISLQYFHISSLHNLSYTLATAQGRALHAPIGHQGYRQPTVRQEACGGPVHSPLTKWLSLSVREPGERPYRRGIWWDGGNKKMT